MIDDSFLSKCFRGDKFQKLIVLFIVSLFLCSPAQGESLRFRVINSQDGLPQNSIRAIAQDQNGLMWFATEDGIARYDGQNLKTYRYDPGVKFPLKENVANRLMPVGQQLWIGTQGEGGVAVLDQAKQAFFPIKDIPKAPKELTLGNVVFSLYQKTKNEILVGSENGVFSVSKDSLTVTKQLVSKSQLKNTRNISAIWEDAKDNLWIASTDGKLAYQTPQGELTHIANDVNGFFRHRRIPSLGDVLVSGLGLVKVDYERKRLVPLFKESFLNNIKVRDIVQAPDGNIWIATRSGLFRYNPAQDIAFLAEKNSEDENSLPTNELSALHISDEGILWIGTSDKGVLYTNIKGFGFTSYSANNLKIVYPKQANPDKQNSFKNNMIWSIFRDSRDTLWIGHSEGLSRQDGNEETYTNLTQLGSIANGFDIRESWMMSTAEAGGYLWFGTWGDGLLRYDPNSEAVVVYSHKVADASYQLSGSVIRLLLFDKKRNVLWVGTHYNSLNRIDLSTGKITKFLTDPNDNQSFPHHRVRALYLDKQNRLWVGSGNGMALFDDATQRFKRVKKYSDDEATTDIRGIFQTDENTIWSSSGYGLNRIDINSLQVEKKYLEKDGLTRSSIYGIINDEQGNFWMPTIRGLTQFNPKLQTFKRFFLGHNLQSNEFNFNASFKEKDGSIIVGGVGGITRFNPSEVQTNVSNYKPVLLGVKSVDNNLQEQQVLGITTQTLAGENSFSLASNQRSIIIDFTIPEYIFAEDLKYEYHLQSSKDRWLPATPRDTPIRYTNLKAGKHTFQVRKVSMDPEQFEPLTINFTIDKYYWEEYWFLALMLATLALASFYVLRLFSAYKIEKQISQERSQLYSMVVHDLGPALNRSSGDLKTLKSFRSDQPPEFMALVKDLESDNQYSLSFINQLRSLSTVEGFNEKNKNSFLLEDIVDESINSFREQKNRIEVKNIPDCTVLAYENSIEFIIKNLISNALQYSEPDTSVSVEIAQIDDKSIIITVADKGVGISETFKKSVFKPYERGDYYKTEGLGIGLTLIKSITQRYQGDITIRNNQPQGTIMQVTLRGVVVAE